MFLQASSHLCHRKEGKQRLTSKSLFLFLKCWRRDIPSKTRATKGLVLALCTPLSHFQGISSFLHFLPSSLQLAGIPTVDRETPRARANSSKRNLLYFRDFCRDCSASDWWCFLFCVFFYSLTPERSVNLLFLLLYLRPRHIGLILHFSHCQQIPWKKPKQQLVRLSSNILSSKH